MLSVLICVKQKTVYSIESEQTPLDTVSTKLFKRN